MSSPAASEQSSAQELYFLYELAKVFSSSLELNEVAEYILDGTCALIGTEQGFLCSLETPAEGQLPVLTPYILREITSSTLQSLAQACNRPG